MGIGAETSRSAFSTKSALLYGQIWEETSHKITPPVPVGMTGIMIKNQIACDRGWDSFPDSEKKNFNLLHEKMFSLDKFLVEVVVFRRESY